MYCAIWYCNDGQLPEAIESVLCNWKICNREYGKMIEKNRQEVQCDSCGGGGFPAVTQRIEPGRRIYPPPCKKYGGKGRLLGARVEKA